MNATEKAHSAAAEAKGKPARPPRRRLRRPSLSHDEFLDRALELFFEQGFEGASIESITASAGIAKRTVYQRFGDKKSLFKAALQRAIDKWIVPIERLQAAESDDLEESLLAIGQILVDNILSPAGLRLLRLTNEVAARMPDVGQYNTRQGTAPTLAYLADLFRRHLGKGGNGFSEADDAAAAFLDLVVGGPAYAAVEGVVRDKATIEARVRYSVRLFLRGLLPSHTDASTGTGSLRDEKSRLKKLLSDALVQLER